MEHTEIITAGRLEEYADTRESEGVIPELIAWLISKVEGLTAARVPYGDAVNQSGLDGFVETKSGFRQYVPQGKSYWEFGTGSKPNNKATKDFRKRTKEISPEDRANCSFVFVTPRSGGVGGWPEASQRRWKKKREKEGWANVIVLDGVCVSAWLREFPAIGKWLAKKIGLIPTKAGFWLPSEHWENLQTLRVDDDPPLKPQVFLHDREQACAALREVLSGQQNQLVFVGESAYDTMDFIAAFLASHTPEEAKKFGTKCLFLDQDDAWLSMVSLKESHVLVAHPKLDLEATGERLLLEARKAKHSVIYQSSGPSGGNKTHIRIPSPSPSSLEKLLLESGYSESRAKEAASAGASSLDALKRHLLGLTGPPAYATGENARSLALAQLLGRFDAKNAEDRFIAERFLAKKTFGTWLETLRSEALLPSAPLSQRDDHWKFVSRLQAWMALGPQIANDDLETLLKSTITVLSEDDPALELPPQERYLASVRGKVRKYSHLLRQGMADTLALLGSHPKALTQCSVGKPEATASNAVRTILLGGNWVRWASLNNVLPLLSEASPEQYLEAIEVALGNQTSNVFAVLFGQESSGLAGTNYLTGVLWGLENLAWNPDYLTRVSVILAQLAEIDPGGNWANRPINSLSNLFLPWFPQTSAIIPQRITAVKAVLKEHPKVGWKLLLKLLPTGHGFSTGSHKPTWRSFVTSDRTGVTTKQYSEQVEAYAELASQVASTSVELLAQLIDRIPNLPPQSGEKVLDHLTSDQITALPNTQRIALWEALTDLASKHRKFSDSNWAMPVTAIEKLESAAVKIRPSEPEFIHRRLFSERDFALMDEKGNYEEQRELLESKRRQAILEIYRLSGLQGVFRFTKTVASSWLVGMAFGSAASDEVDDFLLPQELENPETPIQQFISGFVIGRFYAKEWPWVDKFPLTTWKHESQAIFFSYLPFKKEAWTRVDKVLGQMQKNYWTRVNPNPYAAREHLLEAAELALKYDRVQLALDCLNALVQDKGTFPAEIAVRALKTRLTSTDNPRSGDQHEITSLIGWLQKQSEVSSDEMSGIEWSYLGLLDREFSIAPLSLENRLATDPNFFCEVIRAVFKSEKSKTPRKAKPTNQERNVAQNAYRLLQQWQSVPGVSPEGTLNTETFENWLSSAKTLAEESGHLRVATNQIGQVLRYSPKDPSGFWIHKAVAEVLNDKDSEAMRSGFTMEFFNTRGVFSFSAGKEETTIAAGYQEKADAAEKEGFHRLATAMRGLASSYESMAEREHSRDPYED